MPGKQGVERVAVAPPGALEQRDRRVERPVGHVGDCSLATARVHHTACTAFQGSKRWRLGSGEVRTDVRLYAIQRIAAGQSVDILVRQDDPRCIFDIFDNYRCRQVRVVSNALGRLSLTAVVTAGAAVEGQSVTLTLALPAHGGPANEPIAFPVAAGTEVAVQINIFGDAAPQHVRLQSALSP